MGVTSHLGESQEAYRLNNVLNRWLYCDYTKTNNPYCIHFFSPIYPEAMKEFFPLVIFAKAVIRRLPFFNRLSCSFDNCTGFVICFSDRRLPNTPLFFSFIFLSYKSLYSGGLTMFIYKNNLLKLNRNCMRFVVVCLEQQTNGKQKKKWKKYNK